MPMIEIEQDSPKTLEKARRAIAQMVDDMRKVPGDQEKQHARVLHALGHLSALMIHELISTETWEVLTQELKEAKEAVWAEEDAAKA